MEEKRVNISDVLFFQEGPGVRNTQYTMSGVKLLNVANLVDGHIDLTTSDRYISNDEAYGKYSHFLCDDGDFIVASSGIKVEYIDKKMGFVDSSMLPLCMNTSTIRFKVLDSTILNIRYFMYYLKSRDFKEQLANFITGSAQLNYGPSHLKKMTMPITDLNKQNAIVEHLDKIQFIIDLRKHQLHQLDELVKARFVEMFGDYDLSHIKCDWKPISEIGKVVGGATPKTTVDEYWDGEHRWITPAELSADSGYIYDSVRKLTKAGVDSCSLQEMPIDTVILSSRAPIGKVAIAGNTFYCNQGFKNIICNNNVLPRYLYTVLLLNTEHLNSLGRGATFKEISKSIVENIKIPVPSMELQKQFATFVEQIDKSKVAVQKALDEAQTLFDSLMQEYFG